MTLRMEEVTITPDAVSIGHVYVQHSGAEWRRKYFLRYHMYLILEEVELNDPISFAYCNGQSIASEADADLRDEDSAVLEEKKIPDVRSEDDRHAEAGVTIDDNKRRATYLFHFVFTYLLI